MGHDSTLYTLFWRRLCSCLIWSTVFKSFQSCIARRLQQKRVCAKLWPCDGLASLKKSNLYDTHSAGKGRIACSSLNCKKKAKKYQSTTHPTWMQPISEATIERTFQAGWCFLHAGLANLEVQACPGLPRNLEIYMTQSYRSNMWSSSKYMNLNRHGHMIEWFCSSIRI